MSKLAKCALAVFAILIVAETTLRIGFGLGSPPLSIVDPDLEYMFQPNQHLKRFGNVFSINEVGMRSPSVGPKQASSVRILVLGDSIVNGGALVDQRDLATERLTRSGFDVLNVSAGSWGPQNMLAYLKKFGTFEADELILVLSEHDAWDVPTFKPLDESTHPTHNPSFAIVEVLYRYLPRYLPGRSPPKNVELAKASPQDSAINAIKEILEFVPKTCIILHSKRTHDDDFKSIEAAIVGTPHVFDRTFIDHHAFIDKIHLNADGQGALATAMLDCHKRMNIKNY